MFSAEVVSVAEIPKARLHLSGRQYRSDKMDMFSIMARTTLYWTNVMR